jgi:AraC family transcriptional regulator of adaptative response/methylated-DNA-[protein]-cysteine methyltransferase
MDHHKQATNGAGSLPDGSLWHAVSFRNVAMAGNFIYAVRTTGIYCRPGCPSPTPLRRNTRFYATPADARDAGFRACKRCHPDDLFQQED